MNARTRIPVEAEAGFPGDERVTWRCQRARLIGRKWFGTTLVLAFLLGACSGARANYFSKEAFEPYRSTGPYPFWSKTWMSLEPRVRFDADGIPYVVYRFGRASNPVTVSLFALLAYNHHVQTGSKPDRSSFLHLADWLVGNQAEACGCWFYNFDYGYSTLGETLARPWISAMAQGLGISVLTRAYVLTNDTKYLRFAVRALAPFQKSVEGGGVSRLFMLLERGPVDSHRFFYEEYPTQPAPSFTLNGFMFALLGLYDLAQLHDAEALGLFNQGIETLEVSLPFFDLGNGSAYDLGHLTRPPRSVHSDLGYHMIHIYLLNALGSATNNQTLLWYRDHWNSYGNILDVQWVWLQHFARWVLLGHPYAGGGFFLLLLFGLTVSLRPLAKRVRSGVTTRSARTTMRWSGLVF